MPIEFDCGNCGRHYRVGDANAGKRFRCKDCGHPVTVPSGGGQSAAPRPVATAQPKAHPTATQPRAPQAQRPPVPRSNVANPAPMGQQEQPAAYGNQPAPESKPKGPRGPNYVFLGGAAAMILGFFLPWISIDLGIMSLHFGGYELPSKMNEFIDQALTNMRQYRTPEDPELQKLESAKSAMTSLYTMYLIPLLCLVAVVHEFMSLKKGQNWWWLRAIAAASPVIAFISIVVAFSAISDQFGGGQQTQTQTNADGPSVFDFVGFGFWITLLGFIVTIVGIFTCPKPKKRPPVLGPRRRPPGPARPPGTGNPRPSPVAGGPRANPVGPKPRLPQPRGLPPR